MKKALSLGFSVMVLGAIGCGQRQQYNATPSVIYSLPPIPTPQSATQMTEAEVDPSCSPSQVSDSGYFLTLKEGKLLRVTQDFGGYSPSKDLGEEEVVASFPRSECDRVVFTPKKNQGGNELRLTANLQVEGSGALQMKIGDKQISEQLNCKLGAQLATELHSRCTAEKAE